MLSPKSYLPPPGHYYAPQRNIQNASGSHSTLSQSNGIPPTHAARSSLRITGGLDFRHLGFEQGVQQVLQLTKHLRAGSTNGTLYRSLIDAYQLHLGTANPVLEDTGPRPWSSPGWMTSIRQFLYTTSTKILIHEPWSPQPRRRHDRNIMEDAHRFLPHANLPAINNVQLYLRVTYLSEITDSCGLHLREGHLSNARPSTESTLQWPYQILPLPANWKHWCNAIHTLYTKDNSLMLTQKLEHWLPDHAF